MSTMIDLTRMIGGAVLALGATLVVGPGQDGWGATLAAEAGTQHVVAQDGSGDFTSIGDAVMAASDGDTVLVQPGTYPEAVTIDKDITVTGDGPREAVIVAFDDGQTPIVTLRDTDATLSRLTLSGAGSLVHVIGGAPILEDLLFDGVGTVPPPEASCHANFGPTGCNPVSLSLDGTRATVRGSTFTDSGEVRVHGGSAPIIEANAMSGGSHIFLEEFDDGTVVRANTIQGTEHAAIAIFTTGEPLIEGNTISDAGGAAIEVGLQLAPGITPIIRGNTISGTPTGIEVASGAESTIEDDRLVGNKSALVIAGSDAFVAGNQIEDNGSGVFVMRGSPTLEGNTITGGKVGLGLGSDAATPILSGNTICENETNVSLIFGAEMPDTAGNEICEDASAG